MRFLNFVVAGLFVGPSMAALVDREFPHLIIPLKQDDPAHAYGTQYSGEIKINGGAHQIYTEILFDVPSNAARTCHLEFAIATGNQGGPWTLSGQSPFIFNVSTLVGQTVNKDRDAWNQNTRPAVADWVASVEVKYDGSVSVTGGTVPCVKGQVAQFLLSPGSSRDLDFTWFEEASPIHGITYAMYD